MNIQEKTQWIISRHIDSNHMYDTYLPYIFHLKMVVSVGEEWYHILDPKGFSPFFHSDIYLALWGHDLIEDTRTSYNDCKKVLGENVAEYIYAVTNEKGKNRVERANDKYYQGIVECKGALFVKLCDRIANVRYSLLTKSRMLEMYRKENDSFCEKLWVEKHDEQYGKMFNYLCNLLAPQP